MSGPSLVAAVMVWLLVLPALLGLSLLAARTVSDTTLARLATLHAVSVGGGITAILLWFVQQPLTSVELVGPSIVELGSYVLRPVLLIDRLSLSYAMLVAVVYPVIVRFSIPSFHREPGAARYWFLVTLCGAALCVVSLAGSVDVLYFGWELVGMCSVMLIAFFRASVRANDNSLRALVYYRIGDAFLLSAAISIHVVFPHAHIADFAEDAVVPAAVAVALALVVASLAKAAQLPMSPWLHRAMEGPAASSGIFYGALSVHLGPFLLLRTAPLWLPHVEVRVVMGGIGVLTALWAALVGRTRNDAKTALAYATMTQVGVLYVEIALGFTTLALVHLWAHAGLRTWQFLRSSSLIQDFQDNPLYGAGARVRRPPLLARLLPTSWHERLYLAASRQFWLDGAQAAFVARPLLAVFVALARLEDRLSGPDGSAPVPVPGARARGLRVLAVFAMLALWMPIGDVAAGAAWLVVVGWAVAAARPRAPLWLALPTLAVAVVLGAPQASPWWMAVSLAVVAGVFPTFMWQEQLRRRLSPSDFLVFVVAQPGLAVAIRAVESQALRASPAATEALLVLCLLSAVVQAGLALVRTSASRAVVAIAWSQGALVLAGALGAEAGDAAAVMMAVGCAAGAWVLLVAIEQVRVRFAVVDLAPDNGLGLLAPTTGAVVVAMGWLFVGLPGGVTFIAEDLLFHELFEHHPALTMAFIAASSMNAVALYRVYTGLFGGAPRPPVVAAAQPCHRTMVTTLVIVTALLLVCGVFPQLVLQAVRGL